MRTLTDHIVPGDSVNHQVTISVTDEPGSGGANHVYSVEWDTPKGDGNCGQIGQLLVQFQNGPIKEFGVNGVTQEALLAIIIDRLRSFQKGPFSCEANATALECCGQALYALQERTRARIARGVEGTHKV